MWATCKHRPVRWNICLCLRVARSAHRACTEMELDDCAVSTSRDLVRVHESGAPRGESGETQTAHHGVSAHTVAVSYPLADDCTLESFNVPFLGLDVPYFPLVSETANYRTKLG